MPAPIVNCPTCKRDLEWSEASPWRPFCSERCKMVDLGAWFAEKHRVPDESTEISSAEDDVDS
jgi:uncharacterized protein